SVFTTCSQSRQKYISRATQVPRWRAVIIGKKQLAFSHAVSVVIFPQPKSAGKMTVWPRLLIGNSSVTPCNRDRKVICHRFSIDKLSFQLSIVIMFALEQFELCIRLCEVGVAIFSSKEVKVAC